MKKPTSQGGPNPSNSILDPVTAHRLDPLVDKFAFIPCSGKVPLIKNWPNNDGFHIDEILSFPGCTSIGVKTGLGLLCLDFDGESAFVYAYQALRINWITGSWEVHRDDEKGIWRMKALFSPTPEQIARLPKGEFQSKVKTAEGEALEVFLTHQRQVIIIGKHPDGGNYFWPSHLPEHGPEYLKAPPDEIWDFVLKLAQQYKQPLRKSIHYSGKTKKLNPCIICGRDSNLWCEETQDGMIFCMPGSTFSAEQKHGPLKLGDVVNGYALVKRTDVGGGDCQTFMVHKPTRRPRRPSRPKRRLSDV